MNYGLELLSREDYEKWIADMPPATCPFCKWKKYQYVLYEGKHWIWIACRAPYWKYHTMFVPKRHFEEMNELTVVEMGELMDIYSIAVEKFRTLKLDLVHREISKFMFFWRLRDDPFEARNKSIRMVHFHMHLTPDREGLLDPILQKEACDWDPAKLEIN
jgi:diadenosine tetraphosphate (Ap4A) HIT family hydrolase